MHDEDVAVEPVGISLVQDEVVEVRLEAGRRPAFRRRPSAGWCATAMRRMPCPPFMEIVLTRTSPSAVTRRLDDRAAFPRVLPQHLAVEGSTPIVPGPLMKITCVDAVDRGQVRRAVAEAAAAGRSSAARRLRCRTRRACRRLATITRSPTTSGELEKPHIGIFACVSAAALRDHMTVPVPASSTLSEAGRAEAVDASVAQRRRAARAGAAVRFPEARRVAMPPHRLARAQTR